MSPTVLFHKLPPPTVYLLLAALLPWSSAHVLPRQTTTPAHRTLVVEPWPPLPTAPPPPPGAFLLPRQQQAAPNTVCGFIDADPSLPVTCASGSHCVVDRGAGAIGCCPDGPGACTTGVFTGCVDASSGPGPGPDPFVFTCSGADVCFTNAFEGGLTQVGCGSVAGLAATVATAAATGLSFESVSLVTTTDRESSTSSSSSSSSSSRGLSSSTTSQTPSATETADGDDVGAPEEDRGESQTGAIVGGTLGGVAVLVALVALGYFCWRKRARKARAGPRNMDAKHTSPRMSNGESSTPIAASYERVQSGFGTSAGGGDGAARGPPARGEFDDFHRRFSEALGNIREEDEGGARPGVAVSGTGQGGNAPLWQQNRRQSRNMMWT